MLDKVVDYFGITDKPYNGPTYILPSGYFLDLSKYKHHSDVEKWLIETDLSSYEYVRTGGSPTLTDLNCVRCNTEKYYIALPDKVTREQLSTLLVWLDYLSRTTACVEVITQDNQSVLYDIKMEPTDSVIDRIRRYYSSGRLYEKNPNFQVHSNNFKYVREVIGKPLGRIEYVKTSNWIKTKTLSY